MIANDSHGDIGKSNPRTPVRVPFLNHSTAARLAHYNHELGPSAAAVHRPHLALYPNSEEGLLCSCVDGESCSPGEFTCDDGTCIQVRLQCDGVPHCADRSDEHGCGQSYLLNFPVSSELAQSSPLLATY